MVEGLYDLVRCLGASQLEGRLSYKNAKGGMLEENSPVMVKYESYLGWWNKNSIAFFKQMFSVFNDLGQNNILLVLSFSYHFWCDEKCSYSQNQRFGPDSANVLWL